MCNEWERLQHRMGGCGLKAREHFSIFGDVVSTFGVELLDAGGVQEQGAERQLEEQQHCRT